MASIPSKDEIRSSAGSAVEKAGQVANDAARSSSKLVDRTEDRLEDVDQAGNDLYARGRQRGREALNDLPASLSDMSAAGERVVQHSHQRLVRGVRKQPVEALLLAGAIGYLVGWATSSG